MGVIREYKAYPPAGDGAYGSSVPSEEISCRSFDDWYGAGSDSVSFVWSDRATNLRITEEVKERLFKENTMK